MRQGEAGEADFFRRPLLQRFVDAVGTANQQDHVAAILHPGFQAFGELEGRQVFALLVEDDQATRSGQSFFDPATLSCKQLFTSFGAAGLRLDLDDASRRLTRHALEIFGAACFDPARLAMTDCDDAELHSPALASDSASLRRCAGVNCQSSSRL